MDRVDWTSRRLVLPSCLLLSTLFFFGDLTIPLGVAAGVPYVTIVLLASRSPHPKDALLFGALCSGLTIVGYSLSPDGGERWQVIANRLLAIYAITITAGCVEAVHEQTGELHRVRFDDGDRHKAACQLAKLVGMELEDG